MFSRWYKHKFLYNFIIHVSPYTLPGSPRNHWENLAEQPGHQNVNRHENQAKNQENNENNDGELPK